MVVPVMTRTPPLVTWKMPNPAGGGGDATARGDSID